MEPNKFVEDMDSIIEESLKRKKMEGTLFLEAVELLLDESIFLEKGRVDPAFPGAALKRIKIYRFLKKLLADHFLRESETLL